MREPVRHTPLVTQVSEQFRELIASGEWAIGRKIPGELELAELLGVSRGTVREALRGLTITGLLEPRVATAPTSAQPTRSPECSSATAIPRHSTTFWIRERGSRPSAHGWPPNTPRPKHARHCLRHSMHAHVRTMPAISTHTPSRHRLSPRGRPRQRKSTTHSPACRSGRSAELPSHARLHPPRGAGHRRCSPRSGPRDRERIVR